MEQNTINPDYYGVFIQWAFFFGLIGTWLVPAILFSDLARKHNKKGWVYFLLGLGVGMASMSFTGYLMQLVSGIGMIDTTQTYLIVLFFALPILAALAVFRILKVSFARQD